MQTLIATFTTFWNTLTAVGWRDIIEMAIMTFLIYKLMVLLKDSKAWFLMRGMAAIGVFTLFAYLMRMDTILYLASKSFGVMATAILVVFQPELRAFLARIGETTSFLKIFGAARNEEGFNMKTVEEIVRASFALGRTRTGALIVIEKQISLTEYIETGIALDAVITSQLLINIFEHNTPLHDGAVVIRGDRVAAATCYLPLSQKSDISKALGTRHRAGLGISESTDSITVIVSEETGHVSIAEGGVLEENVDSDTLFERLEGLVVKNDKAPGRNRMIRRRKADEADD